MLTLLGSERRVCNGMTRRKLLQAGGAGLFGLTLPKVLAAEAMQRKQIGSRAASPRAKSVMFVFLFGGPSQLETFDMKPDAASGIRGPFTPIDSRTPGLRISEHLPQLANCSDKYCVVRTLNHPHNDHNGCHFIQTGHPLPPANRGPDMIDPTDKDWPAMGSIVEYFDRRAAGGKPRPVPSYIFLPTRLGRFAGYDYSGQYAGWLGRAYDPLFTDIRKTDANDNPFYRNCTDAELDFRLQGLSDEGGLTLDRLDRRRGLLEQFETARRELDSFARVGQYGDFRETALGMVSSGELRDALNLRAEPDALRDRYGRNLFGQSLLMGRRMIEAGARFVTVLWDMAVRGVASSSWDSHDTLSKSLKESLLPGLDVGFSTLLEDMQQSGLLDETLVVCLGEMGRTPQFKNRGALDGRDHWTYCFPALFAGAGVRGGTMVGESDKDAAYPFERPVCMSDLACTIYDALGIDPHQFIEDPQGRPVSLVDGGSPVLELFA